MKIKKQHATLDATQDGSFNLEIDGNFRVTLSNPREHKFIEGESMPVEMDPSDVKNKLTNKPINVKVSGTITWNGAKGLHTIHQATIDLS